MLSYTTLKTKFKTLAMNSASATDALAGTLINDAHRYLIQKYFDNERHVQLITIGPQDLVLSAPLSVGATSATLSSPWTYQSCQQLVVFSDGEQRNVNFIQNSSNIFWANGAPLQANCTTSISCVGVGTYPLPANVSKVKNTTINVGQLVYTAAPVQSIQEWTRLNALPYTSEIVAYFFIYQGFLNFWPIPSFTGNVIDLYCQIRVSDMTYEDYSTGTLSGLSSGSNLVTGVTTSWNTTGLFPATTDLIPQNLFLTIAPPQGDGLYYLVESFQSDTALTLYKALVQMPNGAGTASKYTIGQYPLLFDDFQDMIVYWALRIYYSSIVKDADRYKMYDAIYQEKEQYLQNYLGTKQVNVNLMESSQQLNYNPNLFPMANPYNL